MDSEDGPLFAPESEFLEMLFEYAGITTRSPGLEQFSVKDRLEVAMKVLLDLYERAGLITGKGELTEEQERRCREADAALGQAELCQMQGDIPGTLKQLERLRQLMTRKWD